MKITQLEIKSYIDKVKALDPKDIATQDNARVAFEGLAGTSQEMRIRATGMLEEMKRGENELNALMEKRERTDPPS
jgi:hypothetical protein